MGERDAAVRETFAALSAPFDPREIKWKPQLVKQNRALAAAYIDCRVVQDRLDAVLGPENWQTEFVPLESGSVQCRLSVRVNGEWVAKTDVGSPSEQPDAGDRVKAAYSDAIKRVAVQWGIGRFLYRLSVQWVDYDPVKKQIISPPQLPDWAVPGKQRRESHPTPTANGRRIIPPQGGSGTAPPQVVASSSPSVAQSLPASGAELWTRLRAFDAKLAGKGICQLGALLEHVTQLGVAAGYSSVIADWSGPALVFGVNQAIGFQDVLKVAGGGSVA